MGSEDGRMSPQFFFFLARPAIFVDKALNRWLVASQISGSKSITLKGAWITLTNSGYFKPNFYSPWERVNPAPSMLLSLTKALRVVSQGFLCIVLCSLFDL